MLGSSGLGEVGLGENPGESGHVGALSVTLSSASLSASATVALVAAVSRILDGTTLSSGAALGLQASLAAALSGVVLSSTAVATLEAELSASLQEVGLSSAAALRLAGQLASVLENTSLDAVGLSTGLDAVLDDFVLAATGGPIVSSTVEAVLAGFSLSSSSEIRPGRIEYLLPYGKAAAPITVYGSSREPVIVEGKARILQALGWSRRNK